MRAMIRTLLAAIALAMPISAPLSAQAETPPPAAVVVAFDGNTITPLIAQGVRNFEGGEPVEFNDPVRIASISKLVMALAALRLMDEGKVDLDRDVSDYLGWKLRSPHHPDASVTLAHLLSHRSGLSDKAGYIIPLGESLEARLADPAAWRETGAPGKAAFEYANLGSPLVATALEAASGERYDRLVERLVFGPLGVEACLNWVGCSNGMVARAVALYRHTGEPARDFPGDLPPACAIPVADGVECSLDDYVPGTNASVFSPQGGVRIGMMDLAKIGQALLDPDGADRFLSPEAQMLFLESMVSAANESPPHGADAGFCGYGLASYVLVDAPPCQDDLFMDRAERFGHGGEANGLRSGLWMALGEGASFAYFITAVPPPSGEVETAASDPREKALIKRALAELAKHKGD
jgi:CubicO group peptidase (beta-lactamase class C family)